MEKFTYTVKDKDGIHARPAGAIIKAATNFKSDITLEANGKSVKLKGGIFALMGMGIRCGTEITLVIEGVDEHDAFLTMRECLEQNI